MLATLLCGLSVSYQPKKLQNITQLTALLVVWNTSEYIYHTTSLFDAEEALFMLVLDTMASAEST